MVPPQRREIAKNFLALINNEYVRAVVRENFSEDNETITLSKRTITNRRTVLESYLAFVAAAFPRLVGSEWVDTEDNPLKVRAYEFLCIRVHSSRGKIGKNAEQLMRYQTLLTLRWDFLWLILENSGQADHKKWTDSTYQWCKGLQRRYNLVSLPMERMIFGNMEVRLLLEEALSNPVNYENALQHGAAILIEFMTGLRPSSLFLTPPYKTFLKNGDITLQRGELEAHVDTT
ncbi:hypothetical protein B0H10DRAFT_2218923 [Mycena sp. CBHHK59/15]|nr:hypothetical protein B0H10DRAFT_2218923 [Mycena sp. CBHHK59/15]